MEIGIMHSEYVVFKMKHVFFFQERAFLEIRGLKSTMLVKLVSSAKKPSNFCMSSSEAAGKLQGALVRDERCNATASCLSLLRIQLRMVVFCSLMAARTVRTLS